MSKDPRSHWDPPADGDFASYVERLSAASAPPPAPPSAAPSAAPSAGAVQPKVTKAADTNPPPHLSAEEATSAAGLAQKLRSVRLVFLLVFVGQVLLLVFFQKGSLPLLFFTGVLWLLLGRGQSALFSASNHAKGGHGSDSPNLQRLHEKLQHLARERATKAKK